MGLPYRVHRGEYAGINYSASVAPTFMRADIGVLYDDGREETFIVYTDSFTADRTILSAYPGRNVGASPGKVFRLDGHVVSAQVVQSGVDKRGRLYPRLVVAGVGDFEKHTLCEGYLYTHHSLSLGQSVEPGPGGGDGYLHLLTLANDVAGTATTTVAMAATNALRKWYGVALYYNRTADVENVIPNIDVVSQPWGALPTGFAATVPLVYRLAGPSLQTGEEGVMFVYNSGGGPGFAATQDNGGVPVYLDTSTNPQPFPLWVHEDDPIDVRLIITNGHADDRYSAYALVEEWLVV